MIGDRAEVRGLGLDLQRGLREATRIVAKHRVQRGNVERRYYIPRGKCVVLNPPNSSPPPTPRHPKTTKPLVSPGSALFQTDECHCLARTPALRGGIVNNYRKNPL